MEIGLMNKHRSRLDAVNYYTATRKYDVQYPRLTQDLDVDVVVIGGGFSGVNTALELAEKGIANIAILEARHLGYGGTGRNGGQVMAGIGHDIDAMEKHVGPDGMKILFQIASEGAGILQARAEKYGINADVHRGYGYLAVNQRQARTLQKWEKEFRDAEPDEDIQYVEGPAVQGIVGSDAYCAAIRHMGGGHVHSLNLLLGEARAAVSLGVKIFENSPVTAVEYGDTIIVRTNSFQIATEPLSDAVCAQISPFRGAYSDISPVINYFRVTAENRLLFGSATRLVEYFPADYAAWNRDLLRGLFPYLADVKIDYAWGGAMACSANLFPQIGSLSRCRNAFFVQGYSGFGVTPSHIVCKVLAEGISEGSARYDLMSSIPHARILGRDKARPAIMTAAKSWHQLSGFFNGR
jgi:gamma-glutamylputrescine oxidase